MFSEPKRLTADILNKFFDNRKQIVLDMYKDNDRTYYHTAEHVLAMLQAVDYYSNLFSPADIAALRIAVLYHDVIYVPGNDNNEYLSARIYELHTEYENFDDVGIFDLILKTSIQYHTRSSDDGLTPLELFLLDIDLISLSYPFDVFVKNQQNILKELGKDENDLRSVVKWLKENFLEKREFIYSTIDIRKSHEEVARDNILKLEQLTQLPEITFKHYTKTRGLADSAIPPLWLKMTNEMIEKYKEDLFDWPYKNSNGVVAYEGDEPVGFITFYHHDNNYTLEVNYGWVDPAHRRKGIYAKLWNEVVKYAKENKVEIIDSYSHPDNEDIKTFNESQGRKPLRMMYRYKVEE